MPDLVAHGFAADRIEVIPNGVPRPEPTRDRAAIRAPARDPRGRLRGLAGCDAPAGEARPGSSSRPSSPAADRNDRIRGLVAGDGPDRAAVAARREVRSRVLGARSDVADLIEACDVVCLTSSAEALPMVVLEAMAGGRAVITTAVGGVASRGRRTGAPAASCPSTSDRASSRLCVDLSRDLGALGLMGAEARSRYEQSYSADRMADRYVDSFRGLARG